LHSLRFAPSLESGSTPISPDFIEGRGAASKMKGAYL